MQARSSEHSKLGLIKPNIWRVFGHPSYKPFKTMLFPTAVKVKTKIHSAPREKNNFYLSPQHSWMGTKQHFQEMLS